MKENQPSSLRRITYPLCGRRLAQELKGKPRPKHVATMADGNRRWVRGAGFADVSHRHRVGSRRIAEFAGWCAEREIELVTIYLLSAENLGRDPEELKLLFDIITDVIDELAQSPNDAHLHMVGHPEFLPKRMTTQLRYDGRVTAGSTGIQVNITVGYGGRQEIVDAVHKITRESIAERIDASELEERITTDAISCHLYTSGQPDPDLVIRTSGEQRLNGFLLWQTAYSEIWFTDAYWPEFHRINFLRVLRDFSQRSRRFGE